MSYQQPGYPQQPGYGQQPGGAPPSNNLVWGILTTLFCCLPFGIVSIVFAAQVNSKWAAGDFNGAQDSANKAKTWAMVAGGVGLAGIILYVILLIAGVATMGATTSTYPY